MKKVGGGLGHTAPDIVERRHVMQWTRSDTIALIDGRHEGYDMAAPDHKEEYLDRYDYLGEGTIYSIGGVVQRGETRLHFYRFKR